MINSNYLKIAACTVFMIFTSACTFGGKFAESAIEYNKAAEIAGNAQVLLNALRAKDNKPMHFSAISQFRGNQSISSTSTLSVQIPTGGDATNVFPLTPSLNVQRSTNPTFDLSIHDGRDFHQGILHPLSLELLEFYWQQRWPRDMLLHLFIHKVEEFHGELFVKRYDNIPEYNAFSDFQKWVADMRSKNIIIGRKRTGDPIGPPLRYTRVSDLKKLVGVSSAKLTLVPLALPRGYYQLCDVSKPAAICFGECKSKPLSEACKEDPVPAITGQAEGQVPDSDIKFRIHLRSVQGILYYLGEVLRAEKAGKNIRIQWGPNKIYKDLFVLKPLNGSSGYDPALAVEYDGVTYAVPDRDDHVTKTVMSLLVQLLGLNKTGKDLPTTTAVQVVGQ